MKFVLTKFGLCLTSHEKEARKLDIAGDVIRHFGSMCCGVFVMTNLDLLAKEFVCRVKDNLLFFKETSSAVREAFLRVYGFHLGIVYEVPLVREIEKMAERMDYSKDGFHPFPSGFGSFEVFWNDSNDFGETGWYWWPCFSGCMPDGEAVGPFPNSIEAWEDARGASE